ncbi:paeninodin family lasso peptide [Paenibacillus oenotherae]|uniref:Paeninodin family lasso peptide n=1 Tax=Paenibacillus oenotherae TaxID=1435645 RepID=A0ABS7DAW3_9BACL|nr:paeninodin family lasso peptide [Paenibacillus oenotherae]MBW7476736.1 paeninodin family lasso peptide [Paenibacillus oenotherae]
MVKKEWQQPALEVLEINMTMAGKGTKYIDFVSPSDLDITDES